MSNRKPDFNVFTSTEQGSRARPRQIGAAWSHETGEGFTIILDALPVDGKIVVFPNTPKPVSESAAAESPDINDSDIPF